MSTKTRITKLTKLAKQRGFQGGGVLTELPGGAWKCGGRVYAPGALPPGGGYLLVPGELTPEKWDIESRRMHLEQEAQIEEMKK